jgi:ornithine cyclodeaminase/alanine dehydrogenase-like protein (mu-crystallin family)
MPPLNKTTVAAAISATDTRIRFASPTNIRAGDVAYIDREAMDLLYQPLTDVPAIWEVHRGASGTGAAPHAVNNQVYTGPPGHFSVTSPQGALTPDRLLASPHINILSGDVFVLSTGGSWQQIGDAGVPQQIALASGNVADYTTAGAIAIQNGTTTITSATARAMTLAAPAQSDDGTVMTIIGTGGGAHTVTVAAGFNGSGGSYDIATFAATGGTLTIQAMNGVWRVLSAVGVTIA